jgi:hypothetical protein
MHNTSAIFFVKGSLYEERISSSCKEPYTMNMDKEQPNQQYPCGQIPGTDFDFEVVASETIDEDEEDPAVPLVRGGWTPVAEILEKLFPPLR